MVIFIGYRPDDNAESATVRVSVIQGAEYREREPAASGMFSAQIGSGDVDPRSRCRSSANRRARREVAR
jgi:hypothetical protein